MNTPTFTALIVDDEPRARDILSHIITKHFPQVQVVAQADSVPEAVKLINSHKPQVVFLDIEMPVYSGLELLQFFDTEKIDFKIIFITAYSEYAIHALRLSAVDYLLKPIQIEQLEQALKRLPNPNTPFSEADRIPYTILSSNQGQPRNKRILLPIVNGYQLVHLADIVALKAEGSYTQLNTTTERLLVSRSLGEFDYLCHSDGFFRVHRSHIVNTTYIKRISRTDNLLYLEGDIPVPISAERYNSLVNYLKTEQ